MSPLGIAFVPLGIGCFCRGEVEEGLPQQANHTP